MVRSDQSQVKKPPKYNIFSTTPTLQVQTLSQATPLTREFLTFIVRSYFRWSTTAIGQRAIAHKLGCSRATVSRAVRYCVEHRLIKKVKRGYRMSNIYELNTVLLAPEMHSKLVSFLPVLDDLEILKIFSPRYNLEVRFPAFIDRNVTQVNKVYSYIAKYSHRFVRYAWSSSESDHLCPYNDLISEKTASPNGARGFSEQSKVYKELAGLRRYSPRPCSLGIKV